MPGALLVLPAAEWRLFAAGDIAVMPGATVVVLPDGLSPQETSLLVASALKAKPSQPGTGSNPPPGVPI